MSTQTEKDLEAAQARIAELEQKMREGMERSEKHARDAKAYTGATSFDINPEEFNEEPRDGEGPRNYDHRHHRSSGKSRNKDYESGSEDESSDIKITKVSFPLDEHNFKSWKAVIQLILDGKDLWHFIDPKLKKHEHMEPSRRQNLAIMTQLITCMKPNQIQYLGTSKDARQSWASLLEAKESESGISQYNRIVEANTMRMGDNGNFEEHNTKFFDLLSDIDQADEGMDAADWKRILRAVMYLSSLPPRFDTFKRTMMQNVDSKKWTAEALRNRARQDNAIQSTHNSMLIEAAQTASFAAHRSNQLRPNKKTRTRFRDEKGNCLHVGHNKDTCYDLHPELRPEWKKHQLENAHQGKPSDNVAANTAVSNQPRNYTTAWTAITANVAAQTSAQDQWIIDSGASRHMTGNRGWLTNLHTIPPSTIEGCGGHKVIATEAGDLNVRLSLQGNLVKFTLNNVLFSPDMAQNLISMRLLREVGIKSLVEDHCELIKDGKSLGYIEHVNNVFPVTLIRDDPDVAYSAIPTNKQF
jgi:hypothetical protein